MGPSRPRRRRKALVRGVASLFCVVVLITGYQLEQSGDSSAPDDQVEVAAQPIAARSKPPNSGPGDNGKACDKPSPQQNNKNCRPPSGV
jgi:hypothetical protein